MFADLAAALAAGLSIWNHKEKNKYRDELLSLQEKYHVETSKPDDARSDAVLDDLEFQLRQLSRAFAAGVAGTDS